MEPIRYPLSKQETIISNSVRLEGVSPAAGEAFRALAKVAHTHSTLSAKEREMVLVAGFAATRNEGGFRVHCLRARDEGATRGELEQLVLLMLGTSLGLAPTVETLFWLDEELSFRPDVA